jgi:hypothetical protein
MKKFSLSIMLVSLLWGAKAQTITSMQTGNWNLGTTWVGGVVPGPSNDVVIDAGHTVTFNVASATINNLTVNATAVLTIAGPNILIVSQDAVNSGTINNNSAGGFRVGNNLTNSSTINGAVNSALMMGGSLLQNNGSLQSSFLYLATTASGTNSTSVAISGSGTFDFNSILVLKSGGAMVTLDVPLTISNMNMGGSNFRIIIGNYDFQTSGIVGGSATKYIITNGSGRMIYSGAVASKIFPVGTATSYTPVTISGGNTATHTFAVKTSNSFTAPPLSSAVVNREWDIDDITGGANADLIFQWNGTDESGSFNRAIAAIARYDGSNWQPITTYAAATGSNPYTRTANGVTSFSQFLIGSAGSFPIISAQSGNWNTGATWSGGIVPSAATDNVIISSAHAISFDVANTTINSLTVSNTASLQVNPGNILIANSNVSNAGAITLGSNANLRVGGDFNNSASLAPSGGAVNTVLSIGGNLINTTGTMVAQSLYFSSTSLGLNTAAQSVNSNNVILNFNSVVLMNDGVPVTLNVPLSFNDLNFNGTTGNLVLENVNLTITNTINGAGAGKYIQTNGSGATVFRTGPAAPKFFPVGTNTSYTPLTISNGNVSTHNFRVRVSNTFTNPPLNNAVVNREWNITDNAAGANVDLTFQWNASDEDPSFNRNNSYVGHYTGTMWTPGSSISPASGSNPYTKTAVAVSSFSPFGIGSSGALPLSWLYFKAMPCGSNVCLEWSTSNEVNTDKFVVERSRNGQIYETVGFVAAMNSNGAHAYNYTDAAVSKATWYYRIKQADIDGRYSFSQVIKIDLNKIIVVSAFPNPAKDFVVIDGAAQFKTIQFIDMSGRMIKQSPVKPNDKRYDIGTLPAGMYYLRFISDNETRFIQLFKE